MYTELGQTLTHNQCGWNWDLLSIYSTLMNAHVLLHLFAIVCLHPRVNIYYSGRVGLEGLLGESAGYGHISLLLINQSFGKRLMGGTTSKGCHQGGVLFSCWPVELLKQLTGTSKPS